MSLNCPYKEWIELCDIKEKERLEKRLEKLAEEIRKLTAFECLQLWRFSPSGHPYFTDPIYEVFKEHFASLGGITPELSKRVGWDDPAK